MAFKVTVLVGVGGFTCMSYLHNNSWQETYTFVGIARGSFSSSLHRPFHRSALGLEEATHSHLSHILFVVS